MKTKHVAVLIIGLLMLSSVPLIATVKADISLPSTQVQLTAVDGSTAYFDSTLSGVDPGFDVQNGVYPGWCVDRSTNMVRGSPHNVLLYSSLSPPADPAISGIDWTAINYILNHKQGGPMDIQNAIWFFADYPDMPLSSATQAMIDAANANSDPVTGPIIAVICLPVEDPDAQISIIEVGTVPGLSPGFWKHNIGVYLGLRNGHFSSPYEGFDKSTMPTFLMGLGIPLEEAYQALNTGGGGAVAQARLDMANALNAAAGFLPYSD